MAWVSESSHYSVGVVEFSDKSIVLYASEKQPVRAMERTFVRDKPVPVDKHESGSGLQEAAVALLVNGEYVSDGLFLEQLGKLNVHNRELAAAESRQLQRAAEERVLTLVLLRQLAIQMGFQVSPGELETERRRRWRGSSNTICGVGVSEALNSELLVRKISDHLCRHVLRPSRMDVEDFYRANLGLFYKPERVLVAHIIKNCEEPESEGACLEVLKLAESKLKAGKPFGKVADQYSDCAGSGGALGWITKGQMVSEFEEVAFALSPGEHSGIFRTIFGFHIATVLSRRPAGPEPFEDIRIKLAQSLYESKRQEAITSAVATFARGSSIVFAPSDLGAAASQRRISI
jgi:hypothetical protein